MHCQCRLLRLGGGEIMPDTDNVMFAQWKYQKIIEEITNFEDNLDDGHEVGVQFMGFGTMKLTGIGFQNPDILYFYGLIGDADAEIIQHVAQMNLLLRAVEKRDPHSPPYRIQSALVCED